MDKACRAIHIDADNCDAVFRKKVVLHVASFNNKSKVTDSLLLSSTLFPDSGSGSGSGANSDVSSLQGIAEIVQLHLYANHRIATTSFMYQNLNMVHIHVVKKEDQSVDMAILASIQTYDLVITRDLVLAKEAMRRGAQVCSDQGEAFSLATIQERIMRGATVAAIRAEHTIHSSPHQKSQKSQKSQKRREKKKMHYRDKALQLLTQWLYTRT